MTVCSWCQHPNTTGGPYCTRCGQPLPPATPPPPPTPTSAVGPPGPSAKPALAALVGVFVVLGIAASGAIVNFAIDSPPESSWTPAQRAEQNRVCIVDFSNPRPDSRAHRPAADICSCWVAYVEARLPYSEVNNFNPGTRYGTTSAAAFKVCDP